MVLSSIAYTDNRVATRDEVHYRARAFGPDARALSLLIVNLSTGGLMARTDLDPPVGARLRVVLPVVGMVAAEVRWSLGGRIGCELDHAIDPVDYHELLAVLVRDR